MPRKARDKTTPEKTPPLVDRQMVDITSVRPNPWNPNMQDAEIFRVLAESLKEEGFGEPVLVRRMPDETLQIVNGEHRYRLAVEAGMKKLPVAVVDMDQTNAMLATLRRNKTRGGLDTIRTAKLLRDMRQRLTEEEIAQRLGFSSEEQQELISMIDAPFVPSTGAGWGAGPGLTYEVSVPEPIARWLDAQMLSLSGKKSGRFEGRTSRKQRGMQVAVELVSGTGAT